MDNFYRAGDFFSRALGAVEAAARAQTQIQRKDMDADAYTSQLDQLGAQGPIPPQYGVYGMENESENHTGVEPLDIKDDLLNRARNKKRESNGSVQMLAGTGMYAGR